MTTVWPRETALGPLRLRNRVIKTATFEGMSPGGRPTDALVAHHARLAAGGVGMTTVAYAAVHPDGRTFAHQLLLDDAAIPCLRRLTDAVHAGGAAASIQLAHCGGFSKNASVPGGRPLAPSRHLNPYGLAYGLPFTRAMTEADLDAVEASFVAGTERALRAGFDAVELHLGHGYLLSQFLSPLFNHRDDAWGGDAPRRRAFPLRVARAVVRAAAGRLAVLAKINLTDGLPGGATVDDAVALTQALHGEGVDALVLSAGMVQRNAFFLLRGGVPIARMAAAESSWLQRVALRAFAPFLVRPYRFSPLFLREQALCVRKACPQATLCLLGGVTGAADLRTAMSDGFDLVAVGRSLIRDPDFLRCCEDDASWTSDCTHCNACVATMDEGGVRCVLPPPGAVMGAGAGPAGRASPS